jgi:hypothetical protein
MDTNRLRTWLGLPPGRWPPDDRELFGFGLERVSPADVELRALELMEKLRPHQLVHPDLVTEGMNRLAQALIALTNETATAGLPGQASSASPPPAVPKPKRHRRPGRTIKPIAPPAARAPDVLEAEAVLVAEAVVSEPVLPPPGRFLPPEPLGREPPLSGEVPVRPRDEPVRVARRAVPPQPRRVIYASLVRLRKLVRGMDGLRPFFSDPGEQLVIPVRVFEYVRAVRDFRAGIDDGGSPRWPVWHGKLVLSLAEHPFSLSIFRNLVPSQRTALAADWANAQAELRDAYETLRGMVRDSKRRNRLRAEVLAARAWLRENPEWLLAGILVLATVIAILRSVSRGDP